MNARIDDDTPPPVALGHIRMPVRDVTPAADWLVAMGVRLVTKRDTFAVLELRGGTHIVLNQSDDVIAPDTLAPVDLMVDDVEAKRADCMARGLEPTEITSGTVHSSFYVPGPGGYRVKITSSHTGGRAV